MKNLRIESVVLALGLLLLGWCIKSGIQSFTESNRVVSVRGLAEREVQADHVIWPIVYKTTGNDLQQLYAHINTVNKDIAKFLTDNGIGSKEITCGAPQIVDLWADRYASSEVRSRDRYNVTSVITVSSKQVDKVSNLTTRVGELLKQGIAVSAGDYGSQVQYQFTSLNAIKPQMIEEATRNAREAAAKFAKDSQSELGKIKHATQGMFTIEDRDQYSPQVKKVRVVTSVDYFLES